MKTYDDSRRPPSPPTTGALDSGQYRNMTAELSPEAAVNADAKLRQAWAQLFVSGDPATQRVCFEDATGAYILDTSANDVRSEGMSYGMTIAVQMDDQARFDRLWTWARTKMYVSDRAFGWFMWHCTPKGEPIEDDKGPAPDGDEYIATALFMAAGRWGNRGGIYDYQAEADALLDAIRERMFIPAGVGYGDLVVFSTSEEGRKFTDPSYHVPAFYHYWSRVAARNREYWAVAAASSRAFLRRTLTRSGTCLPPDYAEFDGTPVATTYTGIRDLALHQDFRYDAWRVAGNLAVDYAWFAADPNEVTQATRLQRFFAARPAATTYGSLWKADGSGLTAESGAGDHSPGLVAMNALAGLASNDAVAWDMLDDLLALPMPSGEYRYYDGLLYMLALLHLTGRFQAHFA